MIYSFTVTFGAKYLTGMVTSVPPYETFSLIKNNILRQFKNYNQRLRSLDGPLPKLCPAVALSRQDGRHSAVALLLKAALIQVSDYRLLGASGFRLLNQ
jgi:hypothetical protein